MRFVCGTGFGQYTVPRRVGIQNVSRTHGTHSDAKDLEQLHKNACEATGFSETSCHSLSRLLLLVWVLLSCRILNGRKNTADIEITVAPWMGRQPRYSGTCQKGRCVSLTTTHRNGNHAWGPSSLYFKDPSGWFWCIQRSAGITRWEFKTLCPLHHKETLWEQTMVTFTPTHPQVHNLTVLSSRHFVFNLF